MADTLNKHASAGSMTLDPTVDELRPLDVISKPRAVAAGVNLTFDMRQFAGWKPVLIRAFMQGVAEVIIASRDLLDGETPASAEPHRESGTASSTSTSQARSENKES